MTEMVRAVLNGEYEIVLPKHRADRPDWYTPQGWEKPRLAALHDEIAGQQRPVVYYVGAEEGEMAALCQMWGADLYLFEPNPKAWPHIRAIWEANSLSHPVTFAGFASNVDAPLWESPIRGFPKEAYDEIDAAHGFKELYLEAAHYPQIRLDSLVEGGHPPPTVMSLDVEGSEWQVLRGAERILREYKPVLFVSIHPEFMFHQWGEYARDLRNWILGFGYVETLLEYAHELHAVYAPRGSR